MHKSATSSKAIDWAARLYLFGMLGLGSLAYSEDVLDRTFLPRFGIAMLSLVLVALWPLCKPSQFRWPALNWSFILLFLFFLWNVQSLFWAATFSQALLESQRVFLSLAVFWWTLFFLENDPLFVQRLSRTAVLVGAIYLAVAFVQLGQIENLDKLALYEVKGLAGHRNLLGALLLLLLGISIFVWKKEKGIWKWGSGLVLLLGLLLLLLLQARSAWVGLALAGGSFALLLTLTRQERWRFDWRIPAAFLLALLLALAWYAWQGSLPLLLDRMNIGQYLSSETAIERLRLWDKSLCTFWTSPWLGVGAGNWQTHFGGCGVHGLYSVELNDVTYQRPHNDFLWVLAETGMIGFALYLAFWGSALFFGLKKLKSLAPANHWEGVLRLSIIIGFGVVASFSFPKERVELLIWTYTLLAWLAYEKGALGQGRVALGSRGLLLLFVVGGLFSGYTLWKRGVGEYEMNQIYFLKAAQKWPAVLQSCDWGESPYYRLDPNAIPINWYRGTAHFSLGQVEAAKADFAAALRIAPFSQHCWNDFGSCLEKLGERKAAKEAYLKALDISPLFDDPRLNLGIIAYKEADYVQALHWVNGLQDSLRAKPYVEAIELAQEGSEAPSK